MKRIITSALFLFALLNARGQYMSFFGDSTWEYHITYLTNIPDDYINCPPEEPNPLGVYCRTYSWQYNKNHYYGDPSIPYPTYDPHGYLDQTTTGPWPSMESQWHMLYEDTLFGRLYWKDIIICDMSLAEGDTFVLPFYVSFVHPFDVRYLLVDSVRYISNRKTIFLSLINHQEDYFYGTMYANQHPNRQFSIRFIEGIGPSYGFIDGYMKHQDVLPTIRFLALLLCFSKDGNLIYMEDENLGCDQTCVGVQDYTQMVMNLYPNPATQYVILDMSTGEEMNGTVVITDMLGRQCLQQKVGETSVRISVTDLPTGMYFLTYLDGERKFTRKFMKR